MSSRTKSPTWMGAEPSVRLVMRIAAMGVDTNDGPVVSYEILALERLHEPLLNLILVRPTVADAPPNLLESFRSDRIHCHARFKVSLDLFVRPCRFEQCDQIA